MQTEPYQPGPAAKRMRRPIEQRDAAFAPVAPSAGLQLAQLAPTLKRVAYLTGPMPDRGWREWALDGLAPAWQLVHYYDEGATPIMRYERRADRRPVELHHAAEWFGAGDYDAETAEHAWLLLAGRVGATFPGAVLLATPATTGRELFLREIPHGHDYPALDDETQRFLRSTLGQARIESPDVLLRDEIRAGERELPGLYEYDGRLMYAALCWGLPCGPPVHDACDAFDEYATGRYLVDVTVPGGGRDEWRPPFGMLGMRDQAGHIRFPTDPGLTFSTWCDGAELRLALRTGWSCKVRERFLWPRYTHKGPLDAWANKLAAMHLRLLEPSLTASDRNRQLVDMVRRAIRQIILTAIGAFQGRERVETRACPIDEPAGVPTAIARVEGGHFLWPVTVPPKWPALAHPEWCATVWGRGRARLLEGPNSVGALHSVGRVVAFSTDAIYLTRRQRWHDDGKVGRMRLVRASAEPVPLPRSRADLLRVRSTLPAGAGG